MPIRHCQKCGLKVLIDDSQSAINPFYCQRCTTAMKNSGEEAPVAAAASAPAPAARQSASAVEKPATVKVLCPYCKASFNGRVPQKPARGACPVCQKELILLPTGGIRAAAGFDATQWQAEQAAAASSTKESGTKTLVKKYAAEPAAAKSDPGTRVLTPPEPVPEPAAAAPAETETADTDSGPGGLPSWLDDNQAPPAAEPAEKTEPDLAPASAGGGGEEGFAGQAELPSWLDDSQAPKPAEPEPVAADAGAYDPTIRVQPDEASQRTPPPKAAASRKAATPPPPPPPAPTGKPARSAVVRKGAAARRTGRHAQPQAAAKATGLGTVLLAYLLLVTPIVACPFLLKQKDTFAHAALDKLGARFQRGFNRIYDKWFKPAPPTPAPKPVAPKPVEKKTILPTAEEKERDKDTIIKAWTELRLAERTVKQTSVGATPAQKADIEKAKAKVDALRKKYEDAREYYRKIHKEEYDPAQQ